MIKVSANKEITNFVNDLISNGEWKIKRGKKHKYHIVNITGQVCSIPSTPSDYRSFLNFRSFVRKVSENKSPYHLRISI